VGSSDCAASSVLEQPASIIIAMIASNNVARDRWCRLSIFKLLYLRHSGRKVFLQVMKLRSLSAKETRRSGFLMMVCCDAYANLRPFQPSGAMIINPAAAARCVPNLWLRVENMLVDRFDGFMAAPGTSID
jgi:hypothetical protein